MAQKSIRDLTGPRPPDVKQRRDGWGKRSTKDIVQSEKIKHIVSTGGTVGHVALVVTAQCLKKKNTKTEWILRINQPRTVRVMGDIADSMIEGEMCYVCGVWLGDGDGYTRLCAGCKETEDTDND